MGMESESLEPPSAARAEARVLEWFRADSRPRLYAAILQAIFCATLGWLLLSLAGSLGAARPPRLGSPPRTTLPVQAIVDADGEPVAPRGLRDTDRSMLFLGTLLVMLSPVALVYRLQRQSRAGLPELLVRTDGLVLREGTAETVVPWDELEDARLARRLGAPPTITLERRDGTELELEARFAGITPEELTLRIRAVRGRALFGLLETPAWPEHKGR